MIGDRNLVFIAIGDNDVLSPTLPDPTRFDTIVAYYGTNKLRAEELSERFGTALRISGGKFQILRVAASSGEVRLADYPSILVMDDDLGLSSDQISTMFRNHKSEGAMISQPAMSRRGKVSHDCTTARIRSHFHVTNFIEMGAPIFSQAILGEFLSHYDGSLKGWGIDHWYMNIAARHGDRFLVWNDVRVVNPHTRSERGGRSHREIDLLQPARERRLAWERLRVELGLENIEPRVISLGPRRPLGQLVAASTSVLFDAAVGLATDPRQRQRLVQRAKGLLTRRDHQL